MTFQKQIVTIGLIILTVWFQFFVISSPTFVKVGMAIAIPAFLFLSIKTEAWWMLVISLFASQITLPGFPGGINLFYFFTAGLLAYSVPFSIINRPEPFRKTMSRVMIYSFLAVIIFIMVVRGFGLSALNGTMWGGSKYLIVFISGGFALRAALFPLSPRNLTSALLIMCTLSLFPLAAETLLVLSKGKIYHLYFFLNEVFLQGRSLYSYETGLGVLRIHSAIFAALPASLAGSILLYTCKRRYARLGTALIIVSFLLAGISGHRIAIITILTFLFVHGLLRVSKKQRWLFVTRSLVGITLALLILSISIRHMPLAFQRSLSWLPGSNASIEAKTDATTTSAWRIRLWKRSLEDLDKYIIVGRGFTTSPSEVAIANERWRQNVRIENYIATHNYHNGPLWLLLDTGLIGLLLVVLFLFFCIREHSRFLRRPWKNARLAQLHKILLAWLITKTIIFFTIFGDLSYLAAMFFIYGLMTVVVRSEFYSEQARDVIASTDSKRRIHSE